MKLIEGKFSQKLINNLIRVNLRGIVNLQGTIKEDNVNHKPKCGKTYNFGKYSLPLVFFIYFFKHKGYLSLEYANNKSTNFATESKSFDKGIKNN